MLFATHLRDARACQTNAEVIGDHAQTTSPSTDVARTTHAARVAFAVCGHLLDALLFHANVSLAVEHIKQRVVHFASGLVVAIFEDGGEPIAAAADALLVVHHALTATIADDVVDVANALPASHLATLKHLAASLGAPDLLVATLHRLDALIVDATEGRGDDDAHLVVAAALAPRWLGAATTTQSCRGVCVAFAADHIAAQIGEHDGATNPIALADAACLTRRAFRCDVRDLVLAHTA